MKLLLTPSGTEVKKVWGYTSIPPCVFMTWCVIKCREFSLPLHALIL
jgi:hypothetical protein